MSAEMVSDDLTLARPGRPGADTPGPAAGGHAHSRIAGGGATQNAATGGAAAGGRAGGGRAGGGAAGGGAAIGGVAAGGGGAGGAAIGGGIADDAATVGVAAVGDEAVAEAAAGGDVTGGDVTGGDLTGGDAIGGDAIGVIELELLKLVRHLETMSRRSSLYARLDRAGYLALRTLDVLGPVNANALAQALGLDASTLTRQITDLERQGFVERRANPADRRSAIIFVTPAGRRAMGEVQAERRVHIEALTSEYDDTSRADLGETLTRLNAALADSVSQRCAAAHRETAGVTGPAVR
jgi:DNA-binding MarR family transcriptional regulator